MQTLARLNPAHLPTQALYGSASQPASEYNKPHEVGWALSPQPFALSAGQIAFLTQLGPLLNRFMAACDQLYVDSLKNADSLKDKPHVKSQVPAWVAEWLNFGKPQALLTFGQMKRFKTQRPLVLRPDLLITGPGPSDFALCEIDAVPGGIGFTSALNQAYQLSGCDVLPTSPCTSGQTMPQAFLAMLLAQARQVMPTIEMPTIAIIVSDEAGDYRPELNWLVTTLQQDYADIHLIHPKQLSLRDQQLGFSATESPWQPIHLVYRFFELFDLPNIANIELLQFAVKKGWVHCTPPFKPHLEEKLWLALLHQPSLQKAWRQVLSDEDLSVLQALVPQGWVLDPSPLPPQAVMPGLTASGFPVQAFAELATATQAERQLVLKPSGFSPLAWGSRGVTIGHDVSQTVWAEHLQGALDGFKHMPFVLQHFKKPISQPLQQLDLETGATRPFEGRTRLCPYYFVFPEQVLWAGTLATSCPADKKMIHGMKDAILAPCM